MNFLETSILCVVFFVFGNISGRADFSKFAVEEVKKSTELANYWLRVYFSALSGACYMVDSTNYVELGQRLILSARKIVEEEDEIRRREEMENRSKGKAPKEGI